MKAVFVKCPHPEMIEAIHFAGLDGAVIDMEQTPLSPRDLYPLVLAAERHNLKVILRTPNDEEQYIKWSLDLGISHIQIPHVNNSNQIKEIEKLAFFNPTGERGLCRFVRAAEFSNIPVQNYLEKANRMTKIIYQIEGLNGINNISSIIDEITMPSIIFLGPYDLSQAVNRPGDIWHEDVTKLMLDVIHQCSEKGIEVGTFTDTKDGINFWELKGISLIEYASDLNLFIDAGKKLLQS